MTDREIEVVATWLDHDQEDQVQTLRHGDDLIAEPLPGTGVKVEVRETDETDDDRPVEADGGTVTQAPSDERETVESVLQACDGSDHCRRLAAFADDRLSRSELDYEDLMYPCRCHRDDGVVLRVKDGETTNYLEYGPGDLFYWASVEERTMRTAVDVPCTWPAFKTGRIDVTPVLRRDTPFAERDDDGAPTDVSCRACGLTVDRDQTGAFGASTVCEDSPTGNHDWEDSDD